MENKESCTVDGNILREMLAHKAKFGSWSPGEKFVMTRLTSPAPLLQHPLVKHKNPKGGDEMVYQLDGDTKALEDAWPFESWRPALDDKVYDLHSNRLFRFRDCKMIRLEDRNILVCEDYLLTGGMACDIEPASSLQKGESASVFFAEAKTGSKRPVSVTLVLGGNNEESGDSKSGAGER